MNDTSAKKDVTKLQRAIVDALEDVKAQDIQVFDTENLSALFERVVVASGTSNRQTKALAASVRDKVRAAGFAKPRIEGEDNGEWIIVDCGIAVVHVMQPTIRAYYNLEELWGEKPVRLKLGAPKPADSVAKAPAKKVAKVQHAGKAPRRAEPEPVKAQMPGRPKKAATPAQTRKAAVAVPAKKAAAKKSVAKAPAASATQTPVKLVKINAPAKSAKKSPAKTVAKTAGKAAPKAAAKRAPAKKATPRSA